MQTVTIRTEAAIDDELYWLELSLQGSLAEQSWHVAQDSEDAFDGGSFSAQDVANAQVRRAGRFAGGINRFAGSAQLEANAKLREIASERGDIRRQIANLRAERRLWSDRTPLGMVEIAVMLGYSADAPRQWKARGILPAPFGTVSGTPYWHRCDVLRWAMSRGRDRALVDLEIESDDQHYLAETA